MFRKIVIILLILVPLLYTLCIGYPIVSQQEIEQRRIAKPGTVISQRCFSVGDFKEFRNCFADHERINGISYFVEVLDDLDAVSPIFAFLFVVCLALFVYLSILIVTRF